MIQQYFENMITGIEAKLQSDARNPNPRKKRALHVARLGKRLYSKDNRVAWCGVTAPFDLLHAMGVTSCFVEFVGAMLATAGAAGPFLEEAEHAGYAADTCGYHRAVIGAAEKGLMPEPDFLIGTTCPCSGGLATLENLARMFKKDLFVLQIPQNDSETSVHYLADQLKELVPCSIAYEGKEKISNDGESLHDYRRQPRHRKDDGAWAGQDGGHCCHGLSRSKPGQGGS